MSMVPDGPHFIAPQSIAGVPVPPPEMHMQMAAAAAAVGGGSAAFPPPTVTPTPQPHDHHHTNEDYNEVSVGSRSLSEFSSWRKYKGCS